MIARPPPNLAWHEQILANLAHGEQLLFAISQISWEVFSLRQISCVGGDSCLLR